MGEFCPFLRGLGDCLCDGLLVNGVCKVVGVSGKEVISLYKPGELPLEVRVCQECCGRGRFASGRQFGEVALEAGGVLVHEKVGPGLLC